MKSSMLLWVALGFGAVVWYTAKQNKIAEPKPPAPANSNFSDYPSNMPFMTGRGNGVAGFAENPYSTEGVGIGGGFAT